MIRPVLSMVLAAAVGCGGEDVVEVPSTAATEPEASSPPVASNAEAELYGTDGQLLASNETVAGLILPRGVEAVREEDRRHVYTTKVPLTKVQRYFGPRLITGQVDRIGQGAIYRRATPRDTQGATVPLDVSIIPTPNGTRIDIIELPPAPTKVPPESEIIRQVTQETQRLD